MNFYFKGFWNKYEGRDYGVCSFSIPEYGILHRSLVIDNKDEILLDFVSLLLMFEFVYLNIVIFKGIDSFMIYSSNDRILKYMKNNSVPKKVIPFKETLDSFTRHIIKNTGIPINFLKVPMNKNLALLNVGSMKLDEKLAEYFKFLSEDSNDTSNG